MYYLQVERRNRTYFIDASKHVAILMVSCKSRPTNLLTNHVNHTELKSMIVAHKGFVLGPDLNIFTLLTEYVGR